jgi:hypothetical protein
MPTSAPDLVFISYSHKDKKWLDELSIRLQPYVRDRSIVCWSDKQINPGSEWSEEINSALAKTKVAVLLVTPNFLASEFINERELGPLLRRAEQGGVQILWVPVRASSYKQTALKDRQAVIEASKPLADMRTGRDQAWVNICEAIERAVRTPSVYPSQSPASDASSQGSSTQKRFPSLIVTKEEFVIENSATLSIRLPRELPDLAAEYGEKAIELEYAAYWKKIHTVAELSYRECRTLHLRSLLYERSQNDEHREYAADYLRSVRRNFNYFWQDFETLPETVKNAEPVARVPQISMCLHVLTRNLTYLSEEKPFQDGLLLIEWICDCLLECLRRADAILDAILKKHFDSRPGN